MTLKFLIECGLIDMSYDIVIANTPDGNIHYTAENINNSPYLNQEVRVIRPRVDMHGDTYYRIILKEVN